ncbi:hypothetical protein MLD38_001539 [Melastoma candidum]|uniref:Uncharacterized protein n=1 Tax=Melastoma candidum TaxID=119954 RepID=A0ACB9SGW4_9MYRT|nr:hypothetical protein MLD38_001539 [Melastoma candidum]
MVEYPINVSPTADENFKRWEYASYNFTLACFWTTPLVCCKETRPQEISTLELDEPDETWASEIHAFDYLIISRVRWFTHPVLFYEERKLVACHCCLMDNVKDLTKFYGYQKAIRTAFRKINATKDYKGIAYLRTLSPSHFENGIWNKGGNCVRTRLFLSNETALGGDEMEMYMIQVEEFRRAEEEGRRRGRRYRLLDTTQALVLRADGHPSGYGHWPEENVMLYNDCVHWRLPGPIDSWSDILLEMMKNEGVRSKAERLTWSSVRKLRG